ncbi:VIT family-domain-containing protein [Lactarius quietus]|nr:VIT family-domain-containing protein [Lactarius quietus]
MSSDAPVSVRLPRATANGTLTKNKPPVWAIDSSGPSVQSPLLAKCARHNREGEVCCQELKGEDERQLIDPDVVRDVVIGLSDGLTVPFALTAGLSSLGESKLVVLGGIAELIAGAISMGIGGFLASQAERDHHRFLRRTTKARVLRSCDGEMEREVHAVLGAVGVDQKVSRQVAHNLLEVESVVEHGNGDGDGGLVDEENGLRWSQSVGITEFLLKFGEGIEEVPTRRLYVSAFTIGMGYLLGGIIPLLPYFFIPKAHVALMYSSLFTGIVLLVFGAVKARITGAAGKGASGYVWGAVSTLAVGGSAAAAAYGIVALLEGNE